MVTPLLVPWNAWRQASCAFAWADEPTPFRVPLKVVPLLLDEEPPEPAWASFAAQEVRASPTVTAAPMARVARECFKVFLPDGLLEVRPGRREPAGTGRSSR